MKLAEGISKPEKLKHKVSKIDHHAERIIKAKKDVQVILGKTILYNEDL